MGFLGLLNLSTEAAGVEERRVRDKVFSELRHTPFHASSRSSRGLVPGRLISKSKEARREGLHPFVLVTILLFIPLGLVKLNKAK
jgi:hypothetical protein